MDKPFISDHCSAVPEYDHAACCVQHDWLYWQGGSRQDRRAADKAFYDCLRTTLNWRKAWIRWLGTRIGGVGFLHTSWRWGYGWTWPRSRRREPDTSPFTTASQREVYEAILKNAIEADQLARDQRRG